MNENNFSPTSENETKDYVWSLKFIKSGMIHFISIGVITILFVLSHLGSEPTLSTIMTYTNAEFTPGLWFTFGYQNYVLGSIGILVFGFVYRHVENNGNSSKKITKILSGIHLIAMNVGLVISSFTLMIVGWITGIAMVSKDYGGQGIDTMTVHNELFMKLVPFGTPDWLGIWISVMAIGIILGSLGLINQLGK